MESLVEDFVIVIYLFYFSIQNIVYLALESDTVEFTKNLVFPRNEAERIGRIVFAFGFLNTKLCRL